MVCTFSLPRISILLPSIITSFPLLPLRLIIDGESFFGLMVWSLLFVRDNYLFCKWILNVILRTALFHNDNSPKPCPFTDWYIASFDVREASSYPNRFSNVFAKLSDDCTKCACAHFVMRY